MAQEAESLGYDTIWCPEIYGADCFTPLTWIGAHTERINLGTSIMQISARTPTSAAMQAATLDYVSNGRLILGIGVSGPQVVEGWYGQPYPKPLARTREWIQIFRKVVARDGPVAFDGKHYKLPLPGGTGLGKPLKLILHPAREHIPLYLGAEGPKNVLLGVENCDGWIPMFLSPYRMMDQLQRGHEPPRSGLRDRRIGASHHRRRRGPGADADQAERGLLCRRHGREELQRPQGPRRPHGASARWRTGFRTLFLSGQRDQAIALVPDELCDEISLVGPKERIRERLQAWKDSPVTMINVGSGDAETLQFMAEELL